LDGGPERLRGDRGARIVQRLRGAGIADWEGSARIADRGSRPTVRGTFGAALGRRTACGYTVKRQAKKRPHIGGLIK
tara:strand:- start:144 stop:374 length:231 start_codon:yes stop_codon:yes gene_type:complete